MTNNVKDFLWGMYVVFKRELFAHLKSVRMLILMVIFTLFALSSVFVGSFVMTMVANSPELMGDNNIQQGPVFILNVVMGFITMIGPIIAIALSFDLIVKEKMQNSLDLLLCRPVSRRAIAFGKFLGTMTALALPVFLVNILAVVITMVLSGKGITILQASGFIIYTILFLTIYIALAQMISGLVKTTTTAILSGIVLWLCFWLFIPIITAILGGQNQTLSTYLGLINPASSYSFCVNDVLGGQSLSLQGGIPVWGYYLTFALWFVISLVLAVEIFHRKKE